MTAEAHAVAGINADFFNIDESQHPGVAATGSSDGPEVSAGQPLEAAVPNAQRFGPGLAPGTSTRDGVGVGADGRARLDSLRLEGTVISPRGRFALAGFNQYAVAQDGIEAVHQCVGLRLAAARSVRLRLAAAGTTQPTGAGNGSSGSSRSGCG
jgi:hypothetical protein